MCTVAETAYLGFHCHLQPLPPPPPPGPPSASWLGIVGGGLCGGASDNNEFLTYAIPSIVRIRVDLP